MIKILKFYTKTCMPCKMMMPILDSLKKKYPDIEILEMDAEFLAIETLNEFGVTNVPTLIIYNNDKEIGRTIGLTSMTKIEEIINN